MNQGFQLLEAFNYAIGVVNSKQGLFAGKLGGLTIGGLGLDACESATRASTLVSNIHAGYLPIMVCNIFISLDNRFAFKRKLAYDSHLICNS